MGELGPVVEGAGLAPGGGQGTQPPSAGLGAGRGGVARGPHRQPPAGVAFREGQHRLAVGAEPHQIGCPLPGGLAVGGRGRPCGARAAEVDQGRRTPAPPAVAPAPLGAG